MSNESSQIGNKQIYVSARKKKNASFKNILKNKYLSWHLMPYRCGSKGVRFNHITVHTLRIGQYRPEQTV